MSEVRKMSTGADSTLRNWIDLTDVFFGQESVQSKLLREKAEAQGYDQEVIADEGQLLMMLGNMDKEPTNSKEDLI